MAVPILRSFSKLSPAKSVALAVAILEVLAAPVHADDWPQWLGPQRDGIWRETGILDTFPTSGLKFRWRVPINGGYTGPAVAKGRVYVMDHPLAKGAARPADAFSRGEIPGTERVLCSSSHFS